MAATVLNSPEAIQMSVFVARAFIKMREALISRSVLERRLLRIENVLLAHDESIRELYDQIRPLLLPPPEPPRKKIGFEAKEAGSAVWKRERAGGRESRSVMEAYNMMYLPHATLEEAELSKYKI